MKSTRNSGSLLLLETLTAQCQNFWTHFSLLKNGQNPFEKLSNKLRKRTAPYARQEWTISVKRKIINFLASELYRIFLKYWKISGVSRIIHNHEKVRCKDEQVLRMSYQTPAKKYRLLKLLAAWLQDDSDFDKYSYYGCHCFPNGIDEMDGGHGEPMDKIDR